MVEFKLSVSSIAELKDKLQLLKNAYVDLFRKTTEIDKEMLAIREKMQAIESIIGKSTSANTGKAIADVHALNISKLSLGEASLEILKATGKSMTATEILDALRKVGREMHSPNSRDMISLSLKKMKDRVEIKKKGRMNYYRAKKETDLFEK